MQVIALSDLHGNLPKPEIITPFDLMLICGDICPVWNHRTNYQEFWLRNSFNNWLRDLPYNDAFSRVICIAGNHDFIFERIGKTKREDLLSSLPSNFVYLEHELYTFEYLEDSLKQITVFGTPYCDQFGNWAFMRSPKYLQDKFSEILEGVDILITHDAPFNMNGLGITSQGRQKGVECGNKELANAIERVQPKYFFCGHIHTGNHAFSRCVFPDTNKEMWSANVSILDEDYKESFNPLTFKYK